MEHEERDKTMIISRIAAFFSLVVLVLLAGAPVKAESVTAAIQRQYESLESFQADFLQQLKNATTGRVEEREGSIAYQKPSLIRWETVTPERELLVVGSDAVWNYVPAEKTAIKNPLATVLGSKTMIRFISGQARLDEDFIVEEQGSEAGLTKLALTPKEPEPSLVQAFVWVDPATNMLRSILLVDFYGNVNRVGLDNLVLNPKLSRDLFAFTPPAGVTVQDNTVRP